MVTIDIGAVGISVVLVGVGSFLFFRGLKYLRIAGRAADTPPSKIRSVAIGFAELNGKAKMNQALTAPFSGRPCVYYHGEIERYETVHTGKSSTTTWVMKWRGEKSEPFSITDGTGTIALKTEQAEFNCAPDKRWYLRPGSSFTMRRWNYKAGKLSDIEPDAYEISPTEGGSRRVGGYRFTERIIAPDEQVYVLGTVKREDDVFVGLDRAHGPFVISDRKEADLLKQMRLSGTGMLVFGVVFAVIAVVVFMGAVI